MGNAIAFPQVPCRKIVYEITIIKDAISIYGQREMIITDKAQYFVLCTLMIQIEGIHLCTELVFLLYTVYHIVE